MNNELLIIVPAYNEAAVIGEVLEEIYAVLPQADVLVIDDGSQDDTAETARKTGIARVIVSPLNLGVGGALRIGYLYASRHNYPWVCQIDADGQHNPADVPRLLEHAVQTGAGLVIGARFAGVGSYSVRGPRRWAMRVLSTVISGLCHTSLTDTTSGFKLTNQSTTRILATHLPAEYLGDTVETLVILAKAKTHISQVGVQMRPRLGGQPSHSPLRAAFFLGRAFLALAVAITRPRLTEATKPTSDSIQGEK